MWLFFSVSAHWAVAVCWSDWLSDPYNTVDSYAVDARFYYVDTREQENVFEIIKKILNIII